MGRWPFFWSVRFPRRAWKNRSPSRSSRAGTRSQWSATNCRAGRWRCPSRTAWTSSRVRLGWNGLPMRRFAGRRRSSISAISVGAGGSHLSPCEERRRQKIDDGGSDDDGGPAAHVRSRCRHHRDQVDSADEFPLKKPLTLIIHVPADQLPPGSGPNLGQAIHNYFEYRMNETRRRLKFFFRDGRIALMVAFVFLLVCMLLRQVARAGGHEVEAG